MKKQKCLDCRFFSGKDYCYAMETPLKSEEAMRELSAVCSVDDIHRRAYHMNLYKLVRRFFSGKNILVLGCHADGEIEHFNDGKRKFTVVEPLKRFADYLSRMPNTKVIRQPWENFSTKEKFDMILCLDCIEHSKEPYKILEKITKLSDKIILSCPNGLYFFQDPHKRMNHGHGPHVSHFTFWQLKRYFKSKGYKVKTTGLTNPWMGPFAFGVLLFAERC